MKKRRTGEFIDSDLRSHFKMSQRHGDDFEDQYGEGSEIFKDRKLKLLLHLDSLGIQLTPIL